MADIAGVLQIRDTVTGGTRYATIQHIDGRIWDGVGGNLETLVVAQWTNYAVAMTETPAGGYFYIGDWPEELTTGHYRITYFDQAGASAAISDPVIFSGLLWFSGSALLPFEADTAWGSF